MSDMMIIPLRVPRELGRAWKVEAVKQDKSVQKWILDQMDRTILIHKTPPAPITHPKQAGVGVGQTVESSVKNTPPFDKFSVSSVTDAVVNLMRPTDEEWIEHLKSLPVTDQEVPERRCFKCKSKVRVWTMTEKGPLCPDCKSQMEVSIP